MQTLSLVCDLLECLSFSSIFPVWLLLARPLVCVCVCVFSLLSPPSLLPICIRPDNNLFLPPFNYFSCHWRAIPTSAACTHLHLRLAVSPFSIFFPFSSTLLSYFTFCHCNYLHMHSFYFRLALDLPLFFPYYFIILFFTFCHTPANYLRHVCLCMNSVSISLHPPQLCDLLKIFLSSSIIFLSFGFCNVFVLSRLTSMHCSSSKYLFHRSRAGGH